ncbi:MAG: AarF/UbiB family protein [Candidatus Woesearchaeota archaeon]
MSKNKLVDFPDVDRFEELTHILIDESLYKPLQKVDLLPKLTVLEGLQDFFESKLPLAHRIRKAAEKGGIIFALFAKYASIRYDVLPQHICKELARVTIPQDTVPTAKTALKEIHTLQPKTKTYKKIRHVYSQDFFHTFALQKGKKELYVQYIRPAVRESIQVDIETLIGFADIFDYAYSQTFHYTFKLLVHEFILHIYYHLHFTNEKEKYETLHSFFSQEDGLQPVKIHTFTNPYVLCFETGKHKKLTSALMTKKVSHTVLKRLSNFLCKPLFEHNVVIQPISIEDVWITSANKVSLLGSVSYTTVTAEQVSHLGKILQSILLGDHHDCVKYFLLAHSYPYVGKSSIQHILYDVKKYFYHTLPKVSMAKALEDIISIYQSHSIQVPESYVLFAAHIKFIEQVITLSGLSVDVKEHLKSYVIDLVKDDIQEHIARYGNLEQIEQKTHVEHEAHDLRTKILRAQQSMDHLENLTTRLIYTVLVCTFIIITSLFILFGQNIPIIVTIPVFVLGCVLIFFLIYETFIK